MRALRHGAVLGLLVVLAAVAGCESGPETVDVLQPALNLSTRHDSILQGETTTVFAGTSNLLGRQTKIEWTTSLGTIQPSSGGNMAQFKSDKPGTAMVTATLTADGRQIRDRINITVNALQK